MTVLAEASNTCLHYTIVYNHKSQKALIARGRSPLMAVRQGLDHGMQNPTPTSRIALSLFSITKCMRNTYVFRLRDC